MLTQFSLLILQALYTVVVPISKLIQTLRFPSTFKIRSQMPPPATEIPEAPGLACKLWSETDKMCVSPNSKETCDGLCEYCWQLDPSELKLIATRTNIGIQSQIHRIRQHRAAKAANTLRDNFLICAMENPLFDGQPWRREYRPTKKHVQCRRLDRCGQDEYCLCDHCLVEVDSAWGQKWTRSAQNELPVYLPPSSPLRAPVVRIRFLCICEDEQHRDAPWFDYLQRGKEGCSTDRPAKAPGTMCHTCLLRFKKMTERFTGVALLLCRFINKDGSLKSQHRRGLKLASVPLSKRSSLD